MNRFTVIIPTRERAEFLEYSLSTCIAQNYENLEILVSDNASTDGTQKVVEKFSRKDKRIRYINPGRRLGMAEHWEFALNNVKEDGYVLILGDDDGLAPDAIQLANRVLEAHPGHLAMNWPLCYYHYPQLPGLGLTNTLGLTVGEYVVERSCHEWLNKILRAEWIYTVLPGVYHGFVHTSVLSDLKALTGKHIHSIIPDIYLAVAVSTRIDSYLHYRRPLSINAISHKSNGFAHLSNQGDQVTKQVFFEENSLNPHPVLPELGELFICHMDSILTARDLNLLNKNCAPRWDAFLVHATSSILLNKQGAEQEQHLTNLRRIACFQPGLLDEFEEALSDLKQQRAPLARLGRTYPFHGIHYEFFAKLDNFGVSHVAEAVNLIPHFLKEMDTKVWAAFSQEVANFGYRVGCGEFSEAEKSLQRIHDSYGGTLRELDHAPIGLANDVATGVTMVPDQRVILSYLFSHTLYSQIHSNDPKLAKAYQQAYEFLHQKVDNSVPLPSFFPVGEKYQKQKRRIKIGVLSTNLHDHACFSIRISDPLTLLGEYVDLLRIAKPLPGSSSYYIRDEIIDSCDLYVIQRLFPSPETIGALEKIYASGRPVLYELDDLLDQIPPEHSMYDIVLPRLPFSRDAIRKATSLLVSTENIKNHYLGLNPNITVFQNQICADRWSHIENHVTPDGPITIGFAGSNTHKPDLRMIEGALLRAARHFGEQICMVFWGCITEDLRTLPNTVLINTEVPYDQYPERLANLGFDIGLIPLADSPFNAAKSDLKWLEYSMLGIPSICSDVSCYAEAKHEGLAIVVSNDEDAWFHAIVKLVEDTQLRNNLSHAAKKYVLEHRVLSKHIGKYAEWINRFVPSELSLPPTADLQLQPLPPQSTNNHIAQDDYEFWLEKHRLQEVDAEILAERMMRWPSQPVFCILMVVRDNEHVRLADTIDSLQQQLYPHWKLIIISGQPSPDPIFEKTETLGWLQIDNIEEETKVAQAVNQLLPVIDVDFFCLAPPGTRFEPHAFVLVSDYFHRHPEWKVAYTDHDMTSRNGERHSPAFKPDFNLDLLRSSNYIDNAVFFRCHATLDVGGILPYPLVENFDLILRLLDAHGEEAIGHVAEPLLSLPTNSHNTHLQEAALRVAVEAHLERSGVAAKVFSGLLPNTLRVEYEHSGVPLISIIIPNRDKIEVLQPCLESLFGKTSYPNFEVVVVDNQSEDPDVFALYTAMAETHGKRFTVINYDAPFNFAAQVNLGATFCQGELLLLLNNDCEIVQPDWLERMLHHARRPEVGAVGPLLIAPESGQVQQAGILLGPPGGLLSIADHAFSGKQIHDPGYLSRLQVDQDYSAVTAACLLVRRDVFAKVGGFDSENFAVLMNDVDFCLRLNKAGYKNVWTPYARVVHHEGRSLKGVTSDPEKILRTMMRERQEYRLMLQRWLPVLAKDPASNRHLSIKNATMQLETRLPLTWEPEIHDRNRVLGFPLVGGSGEYRVAMPLRALAQSGFMHTELVQPLGGKIPEISIIEMARQAPDTLLLHSTVNALMQETLPVWKEFFPDMRVVFGLDDRIDRIPEKSSAYLGHKRHFSDIRLRLRKLLALCDAAVLSTEPLVDMVRGMIDDVRLIPNALERQAWEGLYPRRKVGKKPRVGWVGAQQHRGDLELIYEVIKATSRDIEWVFMGMWLPEFSEYVHERHQFVAFRNYPEKMASLNLDLAIAPLEINEFNEAKSNLRLLEYGILGFPVVCTDIFPYRTQAAPVTCLPNDPNRWIEAIQDKTKNLDQLAREGDALRTWVLDNFMMDQHVNAWYEALTPHA